jgi:Ser-tRNA(Ala) deacylase AlaX
MSIHTAQHLLSAILDTYAEGLHTLSWGFAAHPSLDAPYVELPRALTWAEAEEVERKCNEAIEKAVKIWVDVGVQEEGFVKETAAGVRENRGIPDDYTNVSIPLDQTLLSIFRTASPEALRRHELTLRA